jgi:hypothetical protein
MNWIEVPAGRYKIQADNAKRSQCQIEIAMRYVTPGGRVETTNSATDTMYSLRTRLRMLGRTSPLCGF